MGKFLNAYKDFHGIAFVEDLSVHLNLLSLVLLNQGQFSVISRFLSRIQSERHIVACIRSGLGL